MSDPRNTDLAKIHIARKDLHLDEETYRCVIRDVGRVPSGSSKDLTPTGRARVLAHFREKGWKPKRGPRSKGAPRKSQGMASAGQIKKIKDLWISLADAGVVKVPGDDGLRAWLTSATRKMHPAHTGYHAVEFLPDGVAINVIEQLKKWASRCKVPL